MLCTYFLSRFKDDQCALIVLVWVHIKMKSEGFQEYYYRVEFRVCVKCCGKAVVEIAKLFHDPNIYAFQQTIFQ